MKKKFKFGLKLWSTNVNYIEETKKLFNNNLFNYIELYTMPGTYKDYIEYWKNLEIPFYIHAPHFGSGLNLSDKIKEKSNLKFAEEAIKFTDKLKSDIIIFHPGINGSIDETKRQLSLLNDKRIVIENKPYYGLNNIGICIGSSFEEISNIIENTGVGFCLDIGHAICSANARRIEPLDFFKKFFKLNPKLFHLTDGDYNSEYDKHLHFGKGNYPIKDIIKLIPNDSFITIESEKKYIDKLDDFIEDINYLKNIVD